MSGSTATDLSAAPAEESRSAMPSGFELTILMPCLNEAETLEVCIRKALGFLEKHNVVGEVIIGDNGSTDGSQEIARRLGARVVPVSVRGYGAAIYYGSLDARGKYVIVGDSDDSYDFSDLMPFLNALRGGCDLVMGNRFQGGVKPGAMPWKNRYIGNPILTWIGRLLFHCPSSDFHCGLRGYSMNAFRKMELQTTGMEFASEMVIKSTLLGLNIVEVPTTLSPDGRTRAPHLRPWRDGWRHLRFMLIYSPRWLFFYPGMALMLIGLIVGAWLLPGPRTVAGVTFDIHTLFYASLAVLIGFQGVMFAVFSKTFAVNEGLVPRTVNSERVEQGCSLELGLIAGGALVLLGIAGSIWGVTSWARDDFGRVDPSDMLRVVIPAGMSLALGAQLMLQSFFFSVLQLKRRR
ncbi:MAG: glycosyltransferase family 2 protein [Planctomycetota bacterium]|nr:glycosyltransferase family 2 protein [Planctomycetota bacterium]